jgi:hypothetical protein
MMQRRSFFATLLLAFFRKSQNINADDKLRLMRKIAEDANKIYKIIRNGHMSTRCKYSYDADIEYFLQHTKSRTAKYVAATNRGSNGYS